MDFHWQNLPWGGKFPGEGGNSRKNFTLGDLTEFLHKILVSCLTLSLPIQFCMWRCSGGIILGLFPACFYFWKKNLRKGVFLEWSRNRLEIKVFIKWKYAKHNFSDWIVQKPILRGGRFSARTALSGGNFKGCLYFKLDEVFMENFPCWGEVSLLRLS